MNKSIWFFCFGFLSILNLNASETEVLSNVLKRSPQLISRFYDGKNELTIEAQKTYQRTNLMDSFSPHDLKIENGAVYLGSNKIQFVSTEESSKEIPAEKEKLKKSNTLIYKWSFTVKVDGDYFINSGLSKNDFGVLNDKNIYCGEFGNIVYADGKGYAHLKAGVYNLAFVAKNRMRTSITITNINEIDQVSDQILKKIQDKDGVNYFVETVFMNFAFSTSYWDDDSTSFVKSSMIKLKDTFDARRLNRLVKFYFYFQGRTSLDLYEVFNHVFPGLIEDVLFNRDTNDSGPRGSLYILRALYCSNQIKAAKEFCDKFIKRIDVSKGKIQRNLMLWFLNEQGVCNYLLGIYDEVGRLTKEAYKLAVDENKRWYEAGLFHNYHADPFEEAYKLLTTDVVAESTLFEINDIVDSYDGGVESLNRAYQWLSNVKDTLVLKSDKTGGGLKGSFILKLQKNEKFAKDFRALILSKLKDRIADSISNNDFKKQEALFSEFGSFVKLDAIRVSLFRNYLTKGDIPRSLYIAKNLYESGSMSKEDSQLYLNASKASATAKDVYQYKGDFKFGEIKSQLVLPSYHHQYWLHNRFEFIQTAEIYANNDSFFVNTANTIIALNRNDKKERWRYAFPAEHQDTKNGGPFQKRFFLNLYGNRMTALGATIDPNNRSVLSFKEDGTLLWDSAEYADQVSLEPVCNSFYSAGKLYVFTITKNDSIKILYLTTIDPNTGKYLKSVMLSNITEHIWTNNSYKLSFAWDTYSHDEHFISEGGFVYAYTGTGVVLKLDPISDSVIWARPYHRLANTGFDRAWIDNAGAPSGYIKIIGDIVVTAMTDVQMLIGLDKNTGEQLWTSFYNYPNMIHSRNDLEHLVYSRSDRGGSVSMMSVDFKTGKEKWVTNLYALNPTGEGCVVGDSVFVPVQNGVLVLDIQSGEIKDHILLDVTIDKIRLVGKELVLFSKTNIWFVSDSGVFNPKKISYKFQNENRFIEPNVKPSEVSQMDYPDVENTIDLFEAKISGFYGWDWSRLKDTSKPFYHLLESNDCLMLLNEGFTNANGNYVPPRVVWKLTEPYTQIVGDNLLISKPGMLTCENLFTRELLWSYQYTIDTIVAKDKDTSSRSFVASDGKYVALQLADENVRILDFNTRKILFHLNVSDTTDLQMSNGVLALKIRGEIVGFDLDNHGAVLWRLKLTAKSEVLAEDNMLIHSSYYPKYMTTFYDIRSGKEIVSVLNASRESHKATDWQFTDKYVYAFDNLYDRKTGAIFQKAKEVVPVKTGGFLCFANKFGVEGFYLEGGKEYKFKLDGSRSDHAKYMTAMKKGSDIIVFSPMYIQKFKIVNDQLDCVDSININLNRYGPYNETRSFRYFSLDDSFLAINTLEMSFVRDFHEKENLNTFSTFQVKDDVDWPSKDLSSETQIPLENWISQTGTKPDSKIYYQIGVNSDYAFLKFRVEVDAQAEKWDHKLKIRSSVGNNVSYINWDYDKWENAQSSLGLDPYVSSWKKTDTFGNIYLFLKLKHSSGFLASRRFSNIGALGIEFVSSSKNYKKGFYRIGGSAVKGVDPFYWKLRYDFHSKQISSILKREELYNSLSTLYPQGNEIISWLTNRRKVFGAASNIEWLKGAVNRYKDNFAVVNFISALALEHIIAKRYQGSDIIDKKYKGEIQKILMDLNSFCNGLNINKEWVTFALNLFTIEVYPNKLVLEYGNNTFDLAVAGVYIHFDNSRIYEEMFSDGMSVSETPLYKPHLVYFFPSLISGYPVKAKNSEGELKLSMQHVNSRVSNFGEMLAYSNDKVTTVIDQNGKVSNAECTLGREKAVFINNAFLWKQKAIPTFKLDKNGRPDMFTVKIKKFNMPDVPKGQGLTKPSIQMTVKNLPPDSEIGYDLIDIYKSLNTENQDEAELKDLYASWLKSLDGDIEATVKASWKIYDNTKGEEKYAYLTGVWKDAKVPVMAQRVYSVRYHSIYNNDAVRSFMGPIAGDLVKNPTTLSDFNSEFDDGVNKYKFVNVIPNEKGGKAFWVTKIKAEKKCKATFLFTGYSNLSNSIVNVWLNEKQIISSEKPSDYSRSILSQSMVLKKGDNILLIQIDPGESRNWTSFNLSIGDFNGVPIHGVTFNPLVEGVPPKKK